MMQVVASSASLNLGVTGWAVIGIYAAAMIALYFSSTVR